MTRVLTNGFVDSSCYLHPEEKDAYPWWSYRMKARERNVGWRIGYFIVSERLKDRIQGASIHSEILGSDHCPVELKIDLWGGESMALGIQLGKEGISVSAVAKTVPELLLFFRNEEAPRLRLPFSRDQRLGEVYTLTVSFRELRVAGLRGATLKSAEY